MFAHYLWFESLSLSKHHVWGRQDGIQRNRLGRYLHIKSLWCIQFEKLSEAEQREHQTVLLLCECKTVSGQCGAHLCHICRCSLAFGLEFPHPVHLSSTEQHLPLSHTHQFLLANSLQISRYDIQGHILLSLLAVLQCCLQSQSLLTHLCRNLSASDERNTCPQAEAGTLRIPVGIRIIHGQSTTEGEILSCTGSKIGQTAVACRAECNLLLSDIVLLSLNGNVMCYCMTDALLQSPHLLCRHADAGKQEADGHNILHNCPPPPLFIGNFLDTSHLLSRFQSSLDFHIDAIAKPRHHGSTLEVLLGNGISKHIHESAIPREFE